MLPKYQARHFDYVMGGPNLSSLLFGQLASVAANVKINRIPLVLEPDAPFILRSIAVRVKYDTTSTSHRQTGLNQVQFAFTGPNLDYRQQVPVDAYLLSPWYGQMGNPIPLQKEIVYPAASTIWVDLINNGANTLTNLTFYFRGIKLFPWGVRPPWTYPKKMSLLNWTVVQGQSPSNNTSQFHIPVTTNAAGQRFTLQNTYDGDIVLRSLQAGPTASNTAWEVFLRFYDSDGYPYSNDFVHMDVMAGNATGPASFQTGTGYQTAFGVGPSSPGLFYPEIYIPNRRYIQYDVLRTDASFGTAAAQDIPLVFNGSKVVAA